MTNRERLAKLICESMKEQGDSWSFSEIADHLIEHGVTVLPCKVGDTVYVLTSDSPTGIEETRVSQIKIEIKENGKISYRVSAPCVHDDWGNAHWTFCLFEFGKIVFLTKEEAEQALKGHEGK